MQLKLSLVWGMKTRLAGLFAMVALGATLLTPSFASEQPQAPKVTIKVVAGGESKVPGEQVSQWVVGPGLNEPDPFPGWGGPVGKGGTVAWGGVGRSKRGTIVMAFTAANWHESMPTGNPISAGEVQRVLAEWSGYPRYFDKIGAGHTSAMPAPTGSRILFMRSEDGGKTWSKPQTLADTPEDDRKPEVLALPDGTWICTWYTWMSQSKDPWKDKEIARLTHSVVSRSFDDGRTWTKPMRLQTQDFWPTQWEAANGLVLLKDGSILLGAYGQLHTPAPSPCHSQMARGCVVLPIWKSTDEGKTWKLLSAPGSDTDDLNEPDIAELPNGRLVMLSRGAGNVMWSSDHGKTWTKPVHFTHDVLAPNLTVLKDGTLLCVYGDSSLRAIFSTDGGKTWTAPSSDHGFMIARGVWGYAADVLLPDGTVYISYQHSAIRTVQEIKDSGMLAVRLRVRPDHSGIDLLPPDPQAVLGTNVAVAAK